MSKQTTHSLNPDVDTPIFRALKSGHFSVQMAKDMLRYDSDLSEQDRQTLQFYVLTSELPKSDKKQLLKVLELAIERPDGFEILDSLNQDGLSRQQYFHAAIEKLNTAEAVGGAS